MWAQRNGNNAHGCLSVVLRLQGMQCVVETEGGRLLRILLIRHRSLPTYPGRQCLLRLAEIDQGTRLVRFP